MFKPIFGGSEERLVVIGGEDTLVYIWNKETTELLVKVQGHVQMVNTVHWCPTNANMFISGSDDRSIKLWGINGMPQVKIANLKGKKVNNDKMIDENAHHLS